MMERNLELDLKPPLDLEAHNWLQRMWNSPRIVWSIALIPYFIAVFGSARAIARGHTPGNLVDFMSASRKMLLGRDIYNGGTNGYIYPPLIAFLYQPLALLPIDIAGYVSLAINASVSFFTLHLVSRTLLQRLTGKIDPSLVARVALFAAVCSTDKIKTELFHLETNVFILLAFSAAMRWVDRRPFLCGLALGFAFNIKYLPLVLVPYLLLRKRWSAIGWFALCALAIGLIPALSMGWTANAVAWAHASGGLLKLFGIDLHLHGAAMVPPSNDMISISLTSGIARIVDLPKPFPFLISAAIGLLFCLLAAGTYARNKIPLLAWPPVLAQTQPPFRGLLTIEWMGMLLLTLIFSPFTNSAHLYLLLDVNAAAGVLLLTHNRSILKWPLAAATVLMALGITFPPGADPTFDSAERFWRTFSGASFCMLLMYTALILTNIRRQMTAHRKGDAAS